MRVCVTGSLGFIGGHIVDRLFLEGHEVIGIDNMSANVVAAQRGVKTIARDISQGFSEWDDPQLIIHCASPVGPATMKPDNHTLWKIVRDAQAVLEFAEECGSRVIMFSSAEVLGGAPFGTPRAEYQLGKASMECMAMVHPHPYVQIIRPENVAGRRQNANGGFVLARFRRLLQQGKPLTIFGDGEQCRQFIHVDDVVDFVMQLTCSTWNNPKAIWNISNPENRTNIKWLAARCILKWGSGSVEYVDSREATGNPYYEEVPEKMLHNLDALSTGWKPTRTLDQIIFDALEMEVTEHAQQ